MDVRQVICDAIEKIAPDIEAATIPGGVDFREEAELDSMDFLGVLTTVHDTTGVEIPEIDYSEITTIDDFAAYLASRLES